MACSPFGCARPPNLPLRTAPPPLQQGVARDVDIFEGAGGLSLYGRGYRPSEGEPLGVFVNGLKDHGDHYAVLSQQLVTRGYAAYAFDLRGHGRSTGERVNVERFDHLVDDLDIFVARVREREPGKPIFVFGHMRMGIVPRKMVRQKM